jgi:hypothetical protein
MEQFAQALPIQDERRIFLGNEAILANLAGLKNEA